MYHFRMQYFFQILFLGAQSFYLFKTHITHVNPAHTNPNIPSNLYWIKIWCILLEERSQCHWINFTGPIELKSSSRLHTACFRAMASLNVGLRLPTLARSSSCPPRVKRLLTLPFNYKLYRISEYLLISEE